MPLYFPKGEGELLIDANGNINATGQVPVSSPSGNFNVAIGDLALNSLQAISGDSNIAIGDNTLTNMKLTNAGNIAIGGNSLGSLSNSVSDGVNTALGLNAGFWLTSGDDNTLLGEAAGSSIGATKRFTSGDDNVLIGSQCSTQTGACDRATAIGRETLVHSDSTALGAKAETTKSNQVMLGTNADEVHCPGTFATDFTNTATVGAVTINKIAGRVNIAAAGNAIVVTNNKVTVDSHVFAIVSTNDATAIVKNVVPAAGSFTINLNANATAQTSIDFFVIN